MESGAVLMRIPIKEDIFAFDVYINDKKVPQWKIPKPVTVNTVQEIIIDWLPPRKKVNVKIMAVDDLGQRSEPAVLSGYSSSSLPRISLSGIHGKDHPPASPPGKGGIKERVAVPRKTFRIWAVPDATKVDPVSGSIISEAIHDDLDKVNPVWIEDKKEINLLGIKGEIIGFQLCIEADNQVIDELQLKLTQLTGNNGKVIFADNYSLYKVHYLKIKGKWYPEIAVPMKNGKIISRHLVEKIENQNNQIIYVDLHIPRETAPGSYTGDVVILRNGKVEENLSINFNIEDLMMPKQLSFVPELNVYRGPAEAGTKRFIKAHQIANKHRMVINRVPYSQDGKVHHDMIPKINYFDNDRVKIDWSDYNRRFGPLFDGTAFVDGDRQGVPVEKFYLPFFENWPSVLAINYDYKDVKKKTREVISKHAMASLLLDKALTLKYKMKFIEVIRAFIKHFEEKGWNDTEFQFYLNNKWHWKGASSWWNLDEPVSYDDWMALKYFGSLFKKAKGNTPMQFVFRADISRPRWQHDWLNGLLERMYVQSRTFFKYPGRVRKMKKEGQINFAVYGSLNNIGSSNLETVFWCIRAYLEGADGVLPWQSLGRSGAFTIPDRNALLIDARDILGIDWVVSLRVKALRQGQQIVELMTMLEKNKGFKREQIRNLVYEYFGMVKESFDYVDIMDDSEMPNKLNSNTMENFRRALIGMLIKS
jgi:hypothetical protein